MASDFLFKCTISLNFRKLHSTISAKSAIASMTRGGHLSPTLCKGGNRRGDCPAVTFNNPSGASAPFRAIMRSLYLVWQNSR